MSVLLIIVLNFFGLLNLSGSWTGSYFQPVFDNKGLKPGVVSTYSGGTYIGSTIPFLLHFAHTKSQLAGTIEESGDDSAHKLTATIEEGNISLGQIKFRKRYNGENGWTHNVQYSGTLNPISRTIEGHWVLQEATGSFTMTTSQEIVKLSTWKWLFGVVVILTAFGWHLLPGVQRKTAALVLASPVFFAWGVVLTSWLYTHTLLSGSLLMGSAIELPIALLLAYMVTPLFYEYAGNQETKDSRVLRGKRVMKRFAAAILFGAPMGILSVYLYASFNPQDWSRGAMASAVAAVGFPLCVILFYCAWAFVPRTIPKEN